MLRYRNINGYLFSLMCVQVDFEFAIYFVVKLILLTV